MKPYVKTGIAVIAALMSTSALADVNVKLWMHDHPPRVAVDQEIIASFEAENPGIKIDYQLTPYADFSTRLVTSFAAGAGPTLFNLESFDIAQYKASGFVAPMDYEATGLGDLEGAKEAYGVGLDGVIFDGEVFGLPTEVSNWACVANNDLWQAAGLDPETDAPKTWKELVERATQLTVRDESGIATQRGFDFNWTGPGMFWLSFNPMVKQLGVEMVDENTYEAHLNSPEVARAMQFWADWVNELKLGGPQYTASRDDFIAGNVAMECSFGIWGESQFRASDIDYTFFPAPRWEDAVSNNGFDSYYFYLMVNAHASVEEQEAAWKFARYYTEQGAEIFERVGLFTTQKSVLESETVANSKAIKVFFEDLKTATHSPRVVGFNEIGDLMVSARDRVIGGEDVNAVLEDLQNKVQAVLDRAQN